MRLHLRAIIKKLMRLPANAGVGARFSPTPLETLNDRQWGDIDPSQAFAAFAPPR
jgi:hypothetical protein